MAPESSCGECQGNSTSSFSLYSKTEKIRVRSSQNKHSLAKTRGGQDELISHRLVNLEVSFLREGTQFEVPLKLLRFCGCGSHLDRSANYLCNTHSRLASKMLAFDQKKTLSKANLTNTSKSARVARWCLGTTAAPWTDSLANTGNCDGQGCTLPLHRSLHKSSKVCQLSVAASGTSAAPYCSSHKQGRAASGPSQCHILLHLPNCFPLKHWQRCYDSVTSNVLLLTLSIASTGSDAKVLKLCQASIKTL